MSANLAALAYLIAGVLFILALRGLSHPDTSRRGNLFGMIGMAIAAGFAAVNIFGGFLVTQRMLSMYKKKDRAE